MIESKLTYILYIVVERIGIWESGTGHGPKGTQIGEVNGVSRQRVATNITQTTTNTQQKLILFLILH